MLIQTSTVLDVEYLCGSLSRSDIDFAVLDVLADHIYGVIYEHIHVDLNQRAILETEEFNCVACLHTNKVVVGVVECVQRLLPFY
jgi:hypothetical protein